MADDTGAPPGGLKDLSVEVLQKRIALVEKLNELTEQELSRKKTQIELAESTLKLLSDHADAEERISTLIGEKQKRSDSASAREKKALDDQIANLKKVQGELKKTYGKAPTYYKDLYKEHEAGIKKALLAEEKLGKAAEKTGKKASQAWKTAEELRSEAAGYSMRDLASGAITVLDAASQASIEAANSFDKLSAQTLVFATAMRGMGLDVVAFKAGAMATSIDNSFRGIVKSGVKYTDELQKTFVAALDPASAEKFGMIAAGSADKMLNGVGITAEETKAALEGLKNGAMAFRNSFFIDKPEIAAQTANLVAGMAKFGVQTSDSIKVIDQLTMSMKKSPAQANKSLKKLTNIAHSLDINVGQAVKDFTQLMPKISQFGSRAIDVFADLEAQARATGLGVSELNEVAMRLDTFEGAANAAQQFNAVLGGTFLSVTDLVHAEPADKIEQIKEAMDRSGKSFDTAHRRVKRMVASMLGVDVEKAGRIMGSSEDFKTARKEMDKTAMTNEQLKEKIDAQMTSAELLQKQLSRLGGGFAKFVNRSRGAALEASDAMQAGFKNTLNTVGDIEAAVLSINSIMYGAGEAQRSKTGKTAMTVVASLQAIRQALKAGDLKEAKRLAAEGPTDVRGSAPPSTGGGYTAPPRPSAGPSLSDKLMSTLQGLSNSLSESQFVNNIIIDGETIATEMYEPFKSMLDKDFKLTKKP